MRQKLKKWVGTREFYQRMMIIAVPIMIQNGITNFVNMLDNIMVGRIGTNQMSGVAIINQLLFVFNLCIFGGISGAGIFTAQFFGKGDQEGIRYSFRFKLLTCLAVSLAGYFVLIRFRDPLILRYLHDAGESGNAEATRLYAREYLQVMYLHLLPFALTQAYAGTLRECNETMLPMKAGLAAVLINLCLNYILIYGKFGAPALGVTGAAIATIVSRFAELAIVVFYAHTHTDRFPFMKGLYRSMRIPAALVRSMLIKGTPLLVNEALWSMGQTILVQNYAMRGLEVIAALNISSTISNLFNIVFISLGNAVAIIIGQELGAHKEDVKEDAFRLTFFAVAGCFVVGAALLLTARIFPEVYNTEEEVKRIATGLICVSAVCMPLNAFNNASYFILRSGGNTFITFLFDAVFTWVVMVPLSYVLTHYTGMPIIPLFLLCQLTELLKCFLGFAMVQKGIWINDVTTT